MTATTGFGKPKYGGGGNFAKTFRLKEGTAKFRLLPPMKSLADKGIWKVYRGTHFGYKGVNPKDPSKPQLRTFMCVEEKDMRTKLITQDCPECDLIGQYEEELKQLKATLLAEKKSEDEIEELTAHLTGWLKDHNCDRKWHINVKAASGEFGTLQLSHKTCKLVDALIAKLMTEEGIDALDLDQGVWFIFTRTGKMIDVQDVVTVEEESVRDPGTGKVNRSTKLAPLTEAEAEQALKECPDLSTVVRAISYEQIKLLTTCSGEPEDVDEILAMGQKQREASPRPQAAPKAVEKRVEKQPEQPAPSKAQPAPAPTAVKAEDDEEAALLAQLAAIKAKKAEKAAAPAETPAPAPQAEAAPARTEEKPASVPATPAPVPGSPVNRLKFMEKFKKDQGPQGA